MRSGGFLGKKQTKTEQPKAHPPNGQDLMQLLANCQKHPDKSWTASWQSPSGDGLTYILSVANTAAQRDRSKGWAHSAIDNSGLGEAEWRLVREFEGKRTEVFAMRSSDAQLILTFVEDAMVAVPTSATSWTPDPQHARALEHLQQQHSSPLDAHAPAAPEPLESAPPTTPKEGLPEQGLAALSIERQAIRSRHCARTN